MAYTHTVYKPACQKPICKLVDHCPRQRLEFLNTSRKA